MKYFATVLILFLSAWSYSRDSSKSQLFIENLFFRNTGKTIFSSPEQINLKRLNLLASSYDGKQVVVQGRVDDVSDHATNFLLLTESSKILVFCEKIVVSLSEITSWKKRGEIKVLGVFKLTNQGYPYITLQSVY
jgi:hypothetical protein